MDFNNFNIPNWMKLLYAMVVLAVLLVAIARGAI